MNALLLDVFQCLPRENIQYCLMREVQDSDPSGAEIDILVQGAQLARCSDLLLRLGFLSLPSFGYAPHRFFVTYDRGGDRWYKLDVVTEVAYGSPTPILYTDLAEDCLQSRRRIGDVFVAAPECELLALLMHCALDKNTFSVAHTQRLKTLRNLVTDEHWMTSLLQAHWSPSVSWSLLAGQIDAEDWAGLSAAGQSLKARFLGRHRFSAKARCVLARGQRKLNRLLTARSPRDKGRRIGPRRSRQVYAGAGDMPNLLLSGAFHLYGFVSKAHHPA